jgi:hypothetical protein
MTRGSGIEELLLQATAGLGEARPADLPDVLRLAWLGFITAGTAGQLLALRADPDQYAPLWDNARPVLAAAAKALRASGSLPAGLPDRISLADGPDDPLGDRAAARIRDGILAMALALNTMLPQAGERASIQADRRACRDATALAAELGDCYEGRLRTFLNPHGRVLPSRGARPGSDS